MNKENKIFSNLMVDSAHLHHIKNVRLFVGNFLYCGVCWTKSELFLSKIRTANFDCRASLGRNKNFSARAGKKEGGWGERIFARPRFRRFFFRRRNFSYFALRNAPPERKLCLPRPPVRTQQVYSLYFACQIYYNLVSL